MAGPLAQMVRAKYPGAYDDLTDEQLEQAVTAKYPGVYDDLLQQQPPTEQPNPQSRGWFSPSESLEDFPVYNMAKGAVNVVKAIPGAVYQTVTDPVGTVRGLGEAQGRVGVQAKEAFDQGDYLTAARKGVNYLLPVIGPALDASADKMMTGNVAEGIGETATNAALTFAPFAPKTPRTKPPILKGPTNPKDAAAVQFGKQRGVPLDAGTVTGSNFIKTVQEKAANSFGGARTAETLKGQQADALARVGQELTDAAGPRATNPLAAGERVREVLTGQIQKLNQDANTAYESLRAIEQRKPARPARADSLTALDVSARTPLAVDVTTAVKELQPLYNKLKRESELGIPMQGAKGRTLAALDGLMNAPNWAPLSVVDGVLSDLKAMARGADMPELRTSGQATAAQAVQKLDAQVRTAAAKAGPEVIKELETGRAATKQKWAVAEALDMLSGEPGQVYRQLTQNKDVGLERLRAVQRHAPKEMPNVGRAFLEDMMQQATSEGGFAHTDRLWSNWQKLGSETKRALFPRKGQIEALDNFFLLGKRVGEIKNPSGTAKVAGVLDVVTTVPSWALARMLMTPNGVKWLTEARKVGRSSSPAARTVAVTNLTKAAQSAGVPLEAIPVLTGEPQTAMPPGTRR